MNSIRKYFSLSVWSMSDVAAGLLAAFLVLAMPALAPELNWSALPAGLLGAAVLRHLELHGWTLLRGTLAQRALLLAVWLCAILVGALFAALVGL